MNEGKTAEQSLEEITEQTCKDNDIQIVESKMKFWKKFLPSSTSRKRLTSSQVTWKLQSTWLKNSTSDMARGGRFCSDGHHACQIRYEDDNFIDIKRKDKRIVLFRYSLLSSFIITVRYEKLGNLSFRRFKSKTFKWQNWWLQFPYPTVGQSEIVKNHLRLDKINKNQDLVLPSSI